MYPNLRGWVTRKITLRGFIIQNSLFYDALSLISGTVQELRKISKLDKGGICRFSFR
ncbi:hypothetical protein XBKQ1_430009 [Xenorhabdus bovienii str. kraussei Quebec]|uniref:Uncharacterized protein n=1 Tax=Xenorhabdus bovienii str. kraussei Quebec TaxID=1398203 RepID=A0A077PL96_XENBV|nr:hypothetical protein XBKQ1_430009 [Xenorhabdus bovienii str. kraussei Quebec]